MIPTSTIHRMSIKTKVSLMVLATVATLLFSVSGALFFYFHSMLTDSILSQQFKLVSEIAEQLDGRLKLARIQLYLAAASVHSDNINNPAALQKILDQKEDSRFIFDSGFVVIGADGRVRAESMGIPELVGRDLNFRDYVKEGLKTGKPLISKPFRLSTPPHTPMVAMVAPIRDDRDQVIGLFVGYHSLGAGNFLTSISTTGMEKGYLYILDGRTIVMHADGKRVMEEVPPGKNRGIDRALEGFEGSLENVNSRGVELLSSFKRVGETGWILAANIPTAVAFSPLHRLAVFATVLTIGAIVVSILLVWGVTRHLTRPIDVLTQHIDQISVNKDQWQPISLTTGDELERLAKAFNSMMEAVQTAEQAIIKDRDFYGGIIQNAAAPMFVVDQHHTILFWNNAIAKLTGMSSFQMVGTKRQWAPFYKEKRPVLADLVIDHRLDQIDLYYGEKISSRFAEGAFQSEGWFQAIGGKRRYMFFEAAPVFNSSYEVVAAVETLEDITERKLAEEALTSQNQFLQEIIDAIPNPVFYKDTQGAYIGCNQAFLNFFGLYELEEVKGRTIGDLLPSEYASKSSQMDSTILQEQNLLNYETVLPRADGSERSVLVTKAPFSNPDGTLGGIVGAFVDLTEQRRMDEQVRTMSRAIEQSPATIVITDTSGTIEYVNPKFSQTSGYSAEEAVGKNPRVLKSGEMSDENYALLWQTITSGQEWRGEFHNKRKDGTLYWEYASISPLFDKVGRITGYLAVKEDISARKEVETELARSREALEGKHAELGLLFGQVANAKREWEETLDHLRDIVILADSGHRIRRYNKKLADVTGRPLNQLVGCDWRQLTVETGFTTVSFDGSTGELFHQNTGRSYDIGIYPVRNSQGEVTAQVVSLNDTTELRKAGQELEKAYAELKEAQLQIFQQEKMASIGQLAAGVAHEINNPMGFISSNLTTLNKYVDRLSEFIAATTQAMESCAGSETASQVQQVRKRLKIDHIMEDALQLIAESQDGAGRVRRIVQDLKSFSRVDQADSALIQLNEALETTINIAWNEIKYVATLNREFGDIPEIKCYPQQLNQVFLNLLVNAAHAMEGSQGVITVKTWCDSDTIHVSVTDSGKGIPEANLKKIFEPFFTTKEVGKGTGLGLSISYEIIKKHGGEISVESTVGVGTTFTVSLPLAGPPAVEETP